MSKSKGWVGGGGRRGGGGGVGERGGGGGGGGGEGSCTVPAHDTQGGSFFTAPWRQSLTLSQEVSMKAWSPKATSMVEEFGFTVGCKCRKYFVVCHAQTPVQGPATLPWLSLQGVFWPAKLQRFLWAMPGVHAWPAIPHTTAGTVCTHRVSC